MSKSRWERIIDLMPVGILLVKVNMENPVVSELVYFNRHAQKEIGLDLKEYLNRTMPPMLISKKGILEKYVKAVELQKSRKLLARLKERNQQDSNFSIVLLPAGEDLVAAIYQRVDDKIRAIELAKELNQVTEELEDKDETIQDLMQELKAISVRIKKNGYRE